VPSLGPSRFHPQTLFRLARRIRAVDVTIAHGSSTLPACALVAGPRSPYVIRQISETRFWSGPVARRLRVQLYYRRARHVVALAEGAAVDLGSILRVPRDKITVIPNGVASAAFSPASRAEQLRARADFGLELGRVTVLSIGALVPEKGTAMVIEAAACLPELQVLVVGDGPERESLELLAQRIAPSRVIFTGSIAGSSRAYHAADLVALASMAGDSMPAVLIEAALCGLPAVSTMVGAIPDVVLDDETGLLVSASDQPALTEAIRSLAGDVARRKVMGAMARHWAMEHFEISVVASRWSRVLQDVLASR
jgi:glycosyltransferase involved in cell wall biosynthesis